MEEKTIPYCTPNYEKRAVTEEMVFAICSSI